jgi:hypothetical protein
MESDDRLQKRSESLTSMHASLAIKRAPLASPRGQALVFSDVLRVAGPRATVSDARLP